MNRELGEIFEMQLPQHGPVNNPDMPSPLPNLRTIAWPCLRSRRPLRLIKKHTHHVMKRFFFYIYIMEGSRDARNRELIDAPWEVGRVSWMESNDGKANHSLNHVRIPVSRKKNHSFDKQGPEGEGKADLRAETSSDAALGERRKRERDQHWSVKKSLILKINPRLFRGYNLKRLWVIKRSFSKQEIKLWPTRENFGNYFRIIEQPLMHRHQPKNSINSWETHSNTHLSKFLEK